MTDKESKLTNDIRKRIEGLKRTPREDNWSDINVTLDDALNLIPPDHVLIKEKPPTKVRSKV